MLLVLGLTDVDWMAWYRPFSRKRFDEAAVAGCLFQQTLPHVDPNQPCTIGADGVQMPRNSMKMLGTSWLKVPRSAPFMPGIHRAQRFVHGAWLLPHLLHFPITILPCNLPATLLAIAGT